MTFTVDVTLLHRVGPNAGRTGRARVTVLADTDGDALLVATQLATAIRCDADAMPIDAVLCL